MKDLKIRISGYLVLIIAIFSLISCSEKDNDKIILFAGVGMSNVVKELADTYNEMEGVEVRLNLASSAVLVRQIEADAPADVVIVASKKWADYSEQNELVVSESRACLASNKLVLVTPIDSKMEKFTMDSNTNIFQIFIGKIAIGDPESVPAGKYFMQSVKYFGWNWNLSEKLIKARDVRSALVYSELGEVDASVVFASDALKSDKVKVVSIFPSNSHKPIKFISFKVKGHNELANGFYDFITSKKGKEIWIKHGFEPNN